MTASVVGQRPAPRPVAQLHFPGSIHDFDGVPFAAQAAEEG
jgi:hypothetical protein